jgi:hypothetical protein
MYFRSLLFVLTLFCANCVSAQVVNLLTEDFNNGFPASWTRINADGLTPQPSVSFVDNAWVSWEDPDSTGTGDSVAVATSYYTPAGTANDWMISPPIVLKNHGNFLQWQVKSVDPSYPDGYDLYVTNTAAIVDSFTVARRFFQTDFELPNWTDREVSLDTFAGQTVYFAFKAKSYNEFLLVIDNIRLYADTTLSVHEQNPAAAANVFPNPSTGMVYVSGTDVMNSLSVFDLSGQLQARYMPMSNRYTVPLETLNKGIYVLQIVYANGSSRQVKVIRQ